MPIIWGMANETVEHIYHMVLYSHLKGWVQTIRKDTHKLPLRGKSIMHKGEANRRSHFWKGNSALKKSYKNACSNVYAKKKKFKDIIQILNINMVYLVWKAGCGRSRGRQEQWRGGWCAESDFPGKHHDSTHIEFPVFAKYHRSSWARRKFVFMCYFIGHSNFRKVLQSNVTFFYFNK